MKLKMKMRKTNDALKSLIKQNKKNYKSFMKKLIKIWACMLMVIAVAACLPSCNVTRKVTTESSYYQRGDTTTTIIVKTIESYDATKK